VGTLHLRRVPAATETIASDLRWQVSSSEEGFVTSQPDYWMDGTTVVEFRSGVRVLHISTCTALCGLPGCPQSESCRSYFIYQLRFHGDGSREWRRASSAGIPRDQAIAEASRRAIDAEAFADHRPEDRAAIDHWNAEGCP
jgi:hypothetical protein